MSSLLYEIDRKTEIVRGLIERHPDMYKEFTYRLDVSWIYHDSALEGVVLSYPELKAAIDDEIISDVTLIPAYDDVLNFRKAIEYVRSAGAKKKPVVGLEMFKDLHEILSVDTTPRTSKSPPRDVPGQYRKDNPLHRLYYHEISPPEKITYNMRKLGSWFTEEEAKKMHPVKRAAVAHYKLISIYPWPKHSGKVARLLMNAMLLRDGYMPSIIHAVERQRYYEVLRQPESSLAQLAMESLITTLDGAIKFFEGGRESLRAAS